MVTIIFGFIYTILMVIAFVTLVAGLDSGNRAITRAGLVLVVIWGVWAVVH